MNGYVLHVRIRRTGADESVDRTVALPDTALARLLRLGAFSSAALLFLLAPFAMAAVGGWN